MESTTFGGSMYEDQIDPYEAAMEMAHAEMDAREEAIGLGEIDGSEDVDAEADYWIAQAELEAEMEQAQYDDDPNPYHGDYFEDEGY